MPSAEAAIPFQYSSGAPEHLVHVTPESLEMKIGPWFATAAISVPSADDAMPLQLATGAPVPGLQLVPASEET